MKLTKKTRGLYHIWVKSYKSFQTPRKKKNVLYFIRPLYLEKIFNQLSQKLSNYPCKVYVIDNIYRHLDCCKKHYYKGLVQFQRKANVLLQKSIESKETKLRIQYLDHRRFLGINFRKIWKITSYKKIMHQDGVHLQEPLYRKMISVLAKKFLLREPANNCTSGPG